MANAQKKTLIFSPYRFRGITIATVLFTILFSIGTHANQYVSELKLLNYTDTYGNVSLRNARNLTLPNPMTVKGNLNLEYSKIERLPRKLKVEGNLNLAYSSVKQLPRQLVVFGYINLAHSQVTYLNNGLQVRGDLSLMGDQNHATPTLPVCRWRLISCKFGNY